MTADRLVCSRVIWQSARRLFTELSLAGCGNESTSGASGNRILLIARSEKVTSLESLPHPSYTCNHDDGLGDASVQEPIQPIRRARLKAG
ncbi:unnamed protein product [Protopolystoma xenopodis]|uniref:Uncharacterized protein n=1 Tax=Protopolystoma xenopodis TaxID=117903 RepID=A0A448WWA3_9PLAT|nr:unnamed protein product [Protopolystoma xenopodis]